MPTFEPEFAFLFNVGRVSIFSSVEILINRKPVALPGRFHVFGFGGLGGQEGTLFGRRTDRCLLGFFARWRDCCCRNGMNWL